MLFALHYLKWHYTKAIVDYYRIVFNFIWFFYNLFSIKLSLQTLFSPFHRLSETYEGGVHFEKFFEAVIVNSLMRLVGFLLRTFLITIGLAFIIASIILGAFFFIVWVLAPLLILFLFLFGIKLISVP